MPQEPGETSHETTEFDLDAKVGTAEPAPDLDASQRRRAALRNRGLEEEMGLRGSYAKWVFLLLAAQMSVADAVFVAYGFGEHWKLPTAAIDAWLGATVVQVASIALVVIRFLFPPRLPGRALVDTNDE